MSPPQPTLLGLTLGLPPKALWSNARVHWRIKSRATKAYRRESRYVALEALAGRPRPEWPEAQIQATFYFSCKRRRDRDNALAALKAAFDGLQDAGVVADDSGFTHLSPVMAIDKARPRVELVITPTAIQGD